jgi:DNA polymerase-3 subunit gamma/tau
MVAAAPPAASPRMGSAGGSAPTARRLAPMAGIDEATAPAPMQQPAAAPAEPESVPVLSLADIAALADANRDMAFKILLKRHVRLVRIEPGRLDIALAADAPRALVGDLSNRLQSWTGRRWMVAVSAEGGGSTLAEDEATRRETAFSDARNDPAVAAILARFPGAKVIDVRIPQAAAGLELDDPVPEEIPIDPSADADDEF